MNSYDTHRAGQITAMLERIASIELRLQEIENELRERLKIAS